MLSFPIAILAYNRPENLQKCLNSIMNQSELFNFENLYIYIDSTKPNSNAEDILLNRKVIDIVREISKETGMRFKLATDNRHLTQTFLNFYDWVFSLTNDEAILFLEDDTVLHEDYTKIQGIFREQFLSSSEISSMSFFWPMTSTFPRGINSFYPSGGTKCFAMKRVFFELAKPILIDFVDSQRVANGVFNRESEFFSKLASFNFSPINDSPDNLIAEIHRFHRKLHISHGLSYAVDIGNLGTSGYQAQIQYSAFSYNDQINHELVIDPDLISTIYKEVDANHANYLRALMKNHRIVRILTGLPIVSKMSKFLIARIR